MKMRGATGSALSTNPQMKNGSPRPELGSNLWAAQQFVSLQTCFALLQPRISNHDIDGDRHAADEFSSGGSHFAIYDSRALLRLTFGHLDNDLIVNAVYNAGIER